MRTFAACCILLLSSALNAAFAQESAPDWVNRGSGAFVEGGRNVFRGVGAVRGFKNRSLAAATANLRACDELGKMLASYVSSLERSYELAAQEKRPSGDRPGFEGRLAVTANKAVENCTIKGAVIAGRWRDAGEKTEYSLCELAEDALVAELAESEKRSGRAQENLLASTKKAFQNLMGAAVGSASRLPPAPAPKRQVEWVTAVAFSPDGAKVLTADNKTIAVLEAADGRLLWSKPADADFVAFSKDGIMAVSAGADGLLHIWDAAAGKALKPKDNVIHALSRNRDYASATEAGKGKEGGRFEERNLSRVAKNQIASSLKSFGVDLTAECTQRDYMESTMAGSSGKSSDQQMVSLESAFTYVDPASGATLRRKLSAESTAAGGERLKKEEHFKASYELIAADGKQRLLADTGGALELRGPAGDPPIWAQNVSSLTAVARSPDRSAILTGSWAKRDNLMLWDAETGKNTGAWTLPASVTAIAFAPDGARVILGLASTKDNLQFLRFPAASDGKPIYDKDAAISNLDGRSP